jgi:hypothetical protein
MGRSTATVLVQSRFNLAQGPPGDGQASQTARAGQHWSPHPPSSAHRLVTASAPRTAAAGHCPTYDTSVLSPQGINVRPMPLLPLLCSGPFFRITTLPPSVVTPLYRASSMTAASIHRLLPSSCAEGHPRAMTRTPAADRHMEDLKWPGAVHFPHREGPTMGSLRRPFPSPDNSSSSTAQALEFSSSCQLSPSAAPPVDRCQASPPDR